MHPDVMQWEVPCKPCVVVLLKFFDLNLIMWKLTHLECVGSVSDSWAGLFKRSQCSDRPRKVVDGTEEWGRIFWNWHLQSMNFQWIGGNSCKGDLGDN